MRSLLVVADWEKGILKNVNLLISPLVRRICEDITQKETSSEGIVTHRQHAQGRQSATNHRA